MLYIILLFSFLLSSGIVLYFLPRILLLSLKNRILDRIDVRKVHSTVASRLGGASFLPAIVISVIISSVLFEYAGFIEGCRLTSNTLLILCSTVILYFVGIYDDIVGLRYKEKFMFQFLTALMVVVSGCSILGFNGFLGVESVNVYLGVAISVVLIVFVTNAINLIDGIDGLASMLSIVAFAMYAIMFYFNEDYLNCAICLSAMGALIPFWHHNVFGVRQGLSSKIFMGDGGALVIGFLLAVMAIKLWGSDSYQGLRFSYISNYSWVVAFTMLILPCFDVLRVVLVRARERKPLFLPDRSHFHHKIMALGCSPRRSLVVLLSINTIFLVVNTLLAINHLDITYIVLIDVVMWLTMHVVISKMIISKNGSNLLNA